MLDCYKIQNDKINIDEIVTNYFKSKNKGFYWDLGNNVLYNLCKKHPNHNKEDEVYAKIWLIGTSYAAGVERRISNMGISTAEFYAEKVIPTIKKHGEYIDKRIAELKKYKKVDIKNIGKALLLHKYLIDKVFKDITGLDKRSLASKYLHFHCPNMFFIYDSIANKKIKKFICRERKKKLRIDEQKYDRQDADFCYRALKLTEYSQAIISEKNITPRDIDNILYKEVKE